MTQEKNRAKRFADYINKMNFSEVIEFFNFMMEDMRQLENHGMYDYHIQGDAETILKEIGIRGFENFLQIEEDFRGFMYSTSSLSDDKAVRDGRWIYGFNPWTEILDGYSEWIISHIEDCMNGDDNGAYIEEKYPELYDVVREPKVKVKVAVHKTLTRIVEVEARTHAEAEEWIAKNFEKCDPLMKCDSIGEYFTEILPN